MTTIAIPWLLCLWWLKYNSTLDSQFSLRQFSFHNFEKRNHVRIQMRIYVSFCFRILYLSFFLLKCYHCHFDCDLISSDYYFIIFVFIRTYESVLGFCSNYHLEFKTIRIFFAILNEYENKKLLYICFRIEH